MKNVVILCLFVCLQNPKERKSILERCKLFSNHSLKNSALLSFWGGVPVNRSTCLCIEKDSQFTYLITYDIFTFKVWFESNLHRSILMKVLNCAIGFSKETNEQRMKTFLSEQHATNRNKDSNDFNGTTNSNSPSSILHALSRCRSVHARGFTAGQKNCGKSGLGHQAVGLPGRRAVGRGPLGLRAAGPLGRRGPRACF